MTETVAKNNFYSTESSEKDRQVMEFVGRRIKHVIYVEGESHLRSDARRPDQRREGRPESDPVRRAHAELPCLATRFVTLDNFMNPGDGSMDGWSWAMQGRVTNTEALTQQINYAAVNRGVV